MQENKIRKIICRGFLTPTQQPKAPEATAALIEGREQQGIEVKRLHQEPEKIGHDTVVTEDDRGLAGKLVRERDRDREGGSVSMGQEASGAVESSGAQA